MAEPVSISKSVGRAFAVLELFRENRQPLTAAEIGRRLDCPQPSARALLKTLVALGYLGYAEDTRGYLPTARLAALGRWLAPGSHVPPGLARTVDALAARADDTASLCGLRDGQVDILHVSRAKHPVALQLEPGPGAAAWRTAVGRVLLAGLDPAAVARLLAGWQREERGAGGTAAGRRTLQGLAKELQRVRADGYLAGYDIFLRGVGAICVPVPASVTPPGGGPLVVAVAGLNDRIRQREPALLRILRGELRRLRG